MSRAYATASRKIGEMVGSPRENCTVSWRRGLIVRESSRMVFTSSSVSSWTKPTWLASMKHGSHIMLQRFVRSTVRTAPRPYLIDEVPWLWSRSVTAWKSRPGNRPSMRARNAGSIASTSEKVPCCGHVFSTRIRPSRSTICALISPTCSVVSVWTSCSPLRMRRRASLTHVGHSESVIRGQPSAGLGRSALFSSRPGAQSGWNLCDGIARATVRTIGHATRAAPVAMRSHAEPCIDAVLSVRSLMEAPCRRAHEVGESFSRSRETAANLVPNECLELPAISLPPPVERDCGGDDEEARDLVRGEPRRAELAQLEQRGRRCRRDDDRDQLLAPAVRGNPHHAHVAHARHVTQVYCHLLRMHLPPGNVHERRQPASQHQASIFFESPEVACEKASGAEVRRIGARGVAGRDRRPGDVHAPGSVLVP